MVLHGHALDHLAVIEPWADRLRGRQARNDPFGPDPQPVRAELPAAIARFWLDDALVLAQFSDAMATVPDEDWTRPTDADWTLADHVAHVAGWFAIGADALRDHAAGGAWKEVPPEGLDAFNDRQVRAARGTPAAVLGRNSPRTSISCGQPSGP